jgi:uncharacterized damage-inducible protein DinB
MSDELGETVLAEVKVRLVSGFPAQVRAALDALSEEQVWWRPNDDSNSIGNLVLHTCGSTRHFVGKGVGGSDYARDRPKEFAEKGPVSIEELRRILDETVTETERILDGLKPDRLRDERTGLDKPYTVLALLLRTSHHWAVHVGQIVYAAKALKQGAFHELWMKTMPR